MYSKYIVLSLIINCLNATHEEIYFTCFAGRTIFLDGCFFEIKKNNKMKVFFPKTWPTRTWVPDMTYMFLTTRHDLHIFEYQTWHTCICALDMKHINLLTRHDLHVPVYLYRTYLYTFPCISHLSFTSVPDLTCMCILLKNSC